MGVTTISLGDRETEIYYPTDPSAVAGRATDSYHTADVLPEAIRSMIPAAMDGTFDVGAVRNAEASGKGISVAEPSRKSMRSASPARSARSRATRSCDGVTLKPMIRLGAKCSAQ